MNKSSENRSLLATTESAARRGRTGETGNDSNKLTRAKRELLALWIFVVISFAALMLAAYDIWNKCQGKSSQWPSIHP